MCSIFTKEITYVALTALGTILLAGVTYWLIREQVRLSRTDLQIKTMLLLDDRFNTPIMINERRILSNQLLSMDGDEDPWENVMEFFETMGMLLRRGALDEEMVWGIFSFYIIRYWEGCKEFIRKKRLEDDTFYTDFIFLQTRMYHMESVKRNKPLTDVVPSADDLNKFLNDEVSRE